MYAVPAKIITHAYPASTAIIVARTVLMTEKQPLIPHAQGIRLIFLSERYFNPKGKGIPIKNATGAMISNEKNNFNKRG